MQGEVIRLAFLSARYSEPLDWNDKLVHDAKTTLDKWYRLTPPNGGAGIELPTEFLEALCDDMNLPKAISLMHTAAPQELLAMGNVLGLLQQTPEAWFKGAGDDNVQAYIAARIEAKKAKNWAEADRIRKDLAANGILLEDKPDGTTDWRKA